MTTTSVRNTVAIAVLSGVLAAGAAIAGSWVAVERGRGASRAEAVAEDREACYGRFIAAAGAIESSLAELRLRQLALGAHQEHPPLDNHELHDEVLRLAGELAVVQLLGSAEAVTHATAAYKAARSVVSDKTDPGEPLEEMLEHMSRFVRQARRDLGVGGLGGKRQLVPAAPTHRDPAFIPCRARLRSIPAVRRQVRRSRLWRRSDNAPP